MSPHDDRNALTRGILSLKGRQKTTADVLTRPQSVEELEDGYAFTYPRVDAWSEKLEAFTAAWSKSCPHMTFEVVPSEDGDPLRLHIRGPEGTKQFVEGARIMLTSHLNPAPNVKNLVRHGLRLVTSAVRILPEFLIIGAKKCGTTSLYAYLTKHPSIAPALRKEIFHFNARVSRGQLWYRAFFPTIFERSFARWTGRKGFQSGEATPDYLFDMHTPRKVFAMLPSVKLIALVRNPVDRAYSLYQHNLRSGVEELSFEDALAREEERLAGEVEKVRADEGYWSFAYSNHAYRLRGIYVDQLERWTEHFPKSQLLVHSTEQLESDPAATVARTLDFLGLPPFELSSYRKLNAVPYPEMNAETRRELQRYFEPHNRRLYEFLGTDLGWERD